MGPQEAPWGPRRPQEAPWGPRKPQKAFGGPMGPQEAPRPQEALPRPTGRGYLKYLQADIPSELIDFR